MFDGFPHHRGLSRDTRRRWIFRHDSPLTAKTGPSPSAVRIMVDSLRVALLVESSHGFGRAVLQGIAQYAKACGPWTFFYEERGFDDPMPKDLARWKPDGIIARISTRGLARELRRLRVPIVDLYEQYEVDRHPRVLVNRPAVVRLAVDHLRECGLQHFAFVGFPGATFSEELGRLFAEYVALWGFSAQLYDSSVSRGTARLGTIQAQTLRQAESLATWLVRLPKPVGLLCCNDMRAHQVLAVCREHGIAVPDAVAVIGVDNDEVRCDLATPSLSSVDPNAFRIGYEAAELLNRVVRRQRRSRPTVVVDPLGIVPRGSTDIQAFADPEIAPLIAYIREQACRGLSVDDLLKRFGLSRATMDRWFLGILGRTPHAEIVRVQVQRVRELLATTDLPMKRVARLAGFARVETMYRAFQRATGETPAGYRKSTHRRSTSAPAAVGDITDETERTRR